MTQQVALSMEDAKQKLMRLEEHISDDTSEGLIYEFGRLLAGRLNPELVPMGFVIGCHLLLYDLQKGVDGFTKEPIRSKLIGYPPMIYALLRMEIPTIAEAIFPAEFAAGVKDFVEEVNQKMREEKTAE